MVGRLVLSIVLVGRGIHIQIESISIGVLVLLIIVGVEIKNIGFLFGRFVEGRLVLLGGRLGPVAEFEEFRFVVYRLVISEG